MGLDEVYVLATILNDKINDGTLTKDILKDISIKINVTPSVLYSIDKEFYRISHNDSIEGFKHTNKVEAKIDNVSFVFESNGKADD